VGVYSPLLTESVHTQLRAAQKTGGAQIECSLDLGRTQTQVEVTAVEWIWQGNHYPFLDRCKERTIYYWNGTAFEIAARYGSALIKLVATEWGVPTFEIDGIKMLPTAKISPFVDAQNKVALIGPKGKIILDTCGGLGYFAACCVQADAKRILSFEKNPDVVWLRSLNPWSPRVEGVLTLTLGDVTEHIASLENSSVDAILHDPPRFGIAGELYSQVFYDQLARVLKRSGKLFHYTGTPNKLTTGRDVPNEVATRLQTSGFSTRIVGDGVLATKK
jgi:uncharacterized protein